MTDVKELMAKVGKIRILTNRLIDDQLAGDYHSTFKGRNSDGLDYYRKACRAGWEGALAKDATSGYARGRSRT